MDLQRNVLYMYLVVLLFQTFVSTSSLEVHEVEILEEDMESELDAGKLFYYFSYEEMSLINRRTSSFSEKTEISRRWCVFATRKR